MNYFNNITYDETNDIYSFELSNINTGIANSIRRTIISDIECVSIDYDSIKINKNDSVLHNEIIKERISLIPIYIHHMNTYMEGNMSIEELSLNVTNDKEIPIYVKTESFKVKIKVKEDDKFVIKEKNYEEIINDKFKHFKNIPITRLRKNESLSINASTHINFAKNHSASQTVNSVGFYYKYDKTSNEIKDKISKMDPKEINNYKNCDIEQDYIKTETDEPKTFVFTVEPSGSVDCKYIIKKSFSNLTKHLQTVHKIIKNYQEEDTIIVKESDTIENLVDIYIDNYGHTIGNILNYELNNNENVIFCGYNIQHPLTERLHIRVKTKTNIPPINVILQSINNIIEKLDQIKNEWKKNNNKKKKEKKIEEEIEEMEY